MAKWYIQIWAIHIHLNASVGRMCWKGKDRRITNLTLGHRHGLVPPSLMSSVTATHGVEGKNQTTASCPSLSHRGINVPIPIYTQVNVKINRLCYILFTTVDNVIKRLERGRRRPITLSCGNVGWQVNGISCCWLPFVLTSLPLIDFAWLLYGSFWNSFPPRGWPWTPCILPASVS